MKPLLNKGTAEAINPIKALSLFKAIPNEDLALLDINSGRPEDMIITDVIVPPVCIRPSVAMNSSGTNEDDITVKLSEVVFLNNFIKQAFAKGAVLYVSG